MRDKTIVEMFERKTEFRAKRLEGNLCAPRQRENMIGRLPNSREIIDQRARPVENNIANHNEDELKALIAQPFFSSTLSLARI